jgi:hypothetical protein
MSPLILPHLRRAVRRFALAVVLAVPPLTGLPVAVPVVGAGAARAEEIDRACLAGADAQGVIYAGQARRLSEVRGAIDGDLIRADLCKNGSGYVYIITTLAPNGKVSRRLVDANPPGLPTTAAAAAGAPAAARPSASAPFVVAPARPSGGRY